MIAIRLVLSFGVLLLVLAACATTDRVSTAAPRTGIAGHVTAGPVCPVETKPADPACSPQPVSGAVLRIRDLAGPEIARLTVRIDGSFSVATRPGDYVVEPQPVEGLLGTANPQSVTVIEGKITTIEIVYDTGIRAPATQ